MFFLVALALFLMKLKLSASSRSLASALFLVVASGVSPTSSHNLGYFQQTLCTCAIVFCPRAKLECCTTQFLGLDLKSYCHLFACSCLLVDTALHRFSGCITRDVLINCLACFGLITFPETLFGIFTLLECQNLCRCPETWE